MYLNDTDGLDWKIIANSEVFLGINDEKLLQKKTLCLSNKVEIFKFLKLR